MTEMPGVYPRVPMSSPDQVLKRRQSGTCSVYLPAPSVENVLRSLVHESAHAQDITADQHFVSLPVWRKQIRRDRDSYVERVL
jgi:hypothetical protein